MFQPPFIGEHHQRRLGNRMKRAQTNGEQQHIVHRAWKGGEFWVKLFMGREKQQKIGVEVFRRAHPAWCKVGSPGWGTSSALPCCRELLWL